VHDQEATQREKKIHAHITVEQELHGRCGEQGVELLRTENEERGKVCGEVVDHHPGDRKRSDPVQCR
jgi:hypothetical protein